LHALIAAFAAWLLPLAAFAHVADEHVAGAAHALPVEWNLEPWLLALLALSALGYAVGLRRLWRNAGGRRGIQPWQAGSFWAGWLTLVAALVSPLDPLGDVLFSAHMGQHELLMVVAAPLLVLGRPLATWTWALAPAQRRSVGRLFATRGWSGLWGTLTDPVVAFALHAIALWGWHIPFAFDAALRNEGWHILQHTSFLVTALFFWWSVLGHDPRGRYGPGHSVAWLFATMMHTSALGALLGLSPTVWYEPYVATSAALGIDPVIDQQLGGIIMWVPAALSYVIAALWVLGKLLTRVRA
jgi:putative membrane protein